MPPLPPLSIGTSLASSLLPASTPSDLCLGGSCRRCGFGGQGRSIGIRSWRSGSDQSLSRSRSCSKAETSTLLVREGKAESRYFGSSRVPVSSPWLLRSRKGVSRSRLGSASFIGPRVLVGYKSNGRQIRRRKKLVKSAEERRTSPVSALTSNNNSSSFIASKSSSSSSSSFSGHSMLIPDSKANHHRVFLQASIKSSSGKEERGGGGGGVAGSESRMGKMTGLVLSDRTFSNPSYEGHSNGGPNHSAVSTVGRLAPAPATATAVTAATGGSYTSVSEVEFSRCDARNLVIYEVFVRNHSKEGTFAGVERDLKRIKGLGVEVVWLMPHYPIGFEDRKGVMGSPYAIQDYRGVNSTYGTMEEFERLVRETRRLGMRFMIDIVFNHTAIDSVLAATHPEWFKRDKLGRPTSPWSDVADLSFDHFGLWEYLFDTLVFWAEKGVNGFRCDVASFVPLAFWKEARRRVAEVEDDVLWMAESCDPNFLMTRRKNGEVGLCDSELYQVFDALYDYDLWFRWCAVLAGAERLQRYLEMLQFQEAYLPHGAVKVRFVENHDQRRIMGRAAGRDSALAWTAFAAFNRGAFLIYGGQESEAVKPPELFERDPVEWGNYSLTEFLTSLSRMKKSPAMRNGQFTLLSGDGAIVAMWQQKERDSKRNLFGVFNVESRKEGHIEVPLPDGVYEDILSTFDASTWPQSTNGMSSNGDSCEKHANGNGHANGYANGTENGNGNGNGVLHHDSEDSEDSEEEAGFAFDGVLRVKDGRIDISRIPSCAIVEFTGVLRKARPMTNTMLDFSTGTAVF